jgi:hypothetical protein
MVLLTATAITTVTAAANRQEQQEFLTYENPDYGISIQYPANWTKEDINLEERYQVVKFLPTNETISAASIFDLSPIPIALVSVYALPPTALNLDDNQTLLQFIEKFETGLKSNATDYRLVNSTIIKITNEKNLSAVQITQHLREILL